jgi:hypothetical protein
MATPLSTEETRALEEDGIFLITNIRSSSNRRKVSGALLSPPSSQGSHSSSSSSLSVRFRNFNSSSNFSLDLPCSPHSLEALEFIGFTAQAAAEVFGRWSSRPNPDINTDDLIDYALSEVRVLSTESYQQYHPDEAMVRVGLNAKLRDAITDPSFSAIFSTASLHFWVDDTLRINWLTLLQLLRRLKSCAITSVTKKKQKRAKLEGVFPPKASSSQASATTSQQSIPTAILNISSEDHHLPKTFVAVEKEDPIAPGHIALYKAKASAEMGEPQWIRDDGSLDMSVISSTRGGDFNHRYEAWYFTPEKSTAEMYRLWAARRCPYSDTWVIRIEIPEPFMTGLRTADLYYSQDWKEYIWHCKKLVKPPARFDFLWKQGETDLIKGNICTGVSAKIARIKKEEAQTEISKDNVMTTDAGKALQWVFMREASVEQLGREIRGKIYIEITSSEQAHEN